MACSWLLVLTLALLGLLATPVLPEVVGIIPCLSGFVRDSNGVPIVGADLDFINVITGVKLVTPGDNTDAFGFYRVCVLPGVYNVTFAPPLGSPFMGKIVSSVDLTADQGKELDVVLDFGTVVSGVIRDGNAQLVGNVDIDVDRLSGGRIFTPDDESDATGAYHVVVPNGDYRFRFEPPPGSRLRGLQIDTVIVRANTVLDVTLSAGVLLSGRVTDTIGNRLPGIDIDLREFATGKKVFLANNETDIDGDYSVATPTGVFQLRFSPPHGSRIVGALIDNFPIADDQTVNRTLESGFLVSVSVQDSVGAPIAGADLDFKLESTGEKMFTPNDKTDIGGTALVAVLPDRYRIQVDPPIGSTFDRLIVRDVLIQADTSVVLVLKEVERVSITGTIVDDQGVGLPGVTIEAGRIPGGTLVFMPNDETGVGGVFATSIPIGDYNVFLEPLPESRVVARILPNVRVAADSSWGTITLERGVRVSVNVVDENGTAQADVDLDFVSENTAQEVFTPGDDTDGAGLAGVTVPPDRYTVIVEPQSRPDLLTATLMGVEIRNDTTLNVTLLRSGLSPPDSSVIVLQNYPNPFNGVTTITYVVAAEGKITVRIYNAHGQFVRKLTNSSRQNESFETSWDGTDRHGTNVASGVYFVRVKSLKAAATRKLVLIR